MPRKLGPCAFGDACLHANRQVYADQPHRTGGGAVGHEDCFQEAMRVIGPALRRAADELLPQIRAAEAQARTVAEWAAQPLVRAVLQLTEPKADRR